MTGLREPSDAAAPLRHRRDWPIFGNRTFSAQVAAAPIRAAAR